MDSVSSVSQLSASPVNPAVAASFIKRLSLADKIIGGAIAVGLVSMVLPALSVTVDVLGMTQSSTALVIGVWQGDIGFLCLATAAVALFLQIRKGSAASTKLTYILLGVCGLAPVMGLWLLISAVTAKNTDLGELAEAMKITISFGTYLFLLSGLALGAGGFLKARDAKLLPAAVAAIGT